MLQDFESRAEDNIVKLSLQSPFKNVLVANLLDECYFNLSTNKSKIKLKMQSEYFGDLLEGMTKIKLS